MGEKCAEQTSEVFTGVSDVCRGSRDREDLSTMLQALGQEVLRDQSHIHVLKRIAANCHRKSLSKFEVIQ